MNITLRTLVIDDSDGDVLMLAHELRRGGYEALMERVDAPAAMRAALQRQTWDVVLSAYSLPQWHGPDALALLRESGLDLPFIIVSDDVDELAAVTSLKAGAHDFISKSHLARLVPAIQRELREAENRELRRRAEAALRLAEARQKITMDSMLEGGQIIGFDWRYLYVNDAAAAQGHRTKEELIGRTMEEVYPGIEQTAMFGVLRRCMHERVAQRMENEFTYPNGSKGWFILNLEPVPEGLFILSHDITEQKRAESRILRTMAQLEALRAIDIAITSNLDLENILAVFLEQVAAQLGVDGADVLLLDPSTNILSLAAGRGFRVKASQQAHQRLGEGHAGRAALERRTVTVDNLRGVGSPLQRTGLLVQEDFVSYVAVPLIAKDHVIGVLEVFHRGHLEPDPEWNRFLEALAGQAAIAVDNAQLFENLQRSHADLAAAYESTIEGWSRALDLRDRETEGHTRRVTALTLRLARELGVTDQDLTHIRRGALLHDIGKMGVPDSILLKPGPLTEEEWVVMRKHTELAYDWLAPIEYLRPALDIPYCHHEKWDGSGYPRHLAGEQIPLVARIFAVVDVYDALRSDRPYRLAWSEETVRDYIREQDGKHFDPRIVAVFLQQAGSDAVA